jgi:asparagine synthase (glutamine-hydrolysing)
MRDALAGRDACEGLRSALPPDFAHWSPLAKAAHLEVTTLLEPYLLASQGDRVALAHGVEARYPFLDPRLFAFATSLPDDMKLRGLDEKWILRAWARGRIQRSVAERPKQPYRALDAPSFFGAQAPSYVRELLDPDRMRAAGVFDPSRVAGLIQRCRSGRVSGFAENQAVVAVISTQLWYEAFISAAVRAEGLPVDSADVLLTDDTHALNPVGVSHQPGLLQRN